MARWAEHSTQRESPGQKLTDRTSLKISSAAGRPLELTQKVRWNEAGKWGEKLERSRTFEFHRQYKEFLYFYLENNGNILDSLGE
jgi:hypothetical protein